MVLITGGQDSSGNALGSAELYNPATGTFSTIASLNTPREWHTASLLNNGKVLVAGGSNNTTMALADAELYDPIAGTFSVTGSLSTGRNSHTATLLNNGTVLVGGGWDINGNVLASLDLYDPTAGAFTSPGNLSTARGGSTETLLITGTVLLAGGSDNNGNALASAELYQPNTLAPSGLVSITISPANTSIFVGSSQQFVATGTFGDSSTQSLASATWSSSNSAIASLTNDATNFGNAMGVAQGAATVSACTGSICGSTTLTITVGSGTAPVPSITSLSPASGPAGTLVTIAGTNFGIPQGASTVTFNGATASVVSWGTGSIGAQVPSGATSGNVVVTVNSTASNGLPFTVVVPNIAGLSPNSGPVGTSVTLTGTNFGPTQGSSTVMLNGVLLSPTNWSDTSITAALPLGATTGNIIVTANGSASNGVEFMVVASTGNATPGSLNAARYGATGNLLDNGTVLITGGMDSNYNPVPNAEIYDPDAGTFTAVGSLNTVRDYQTATLLNNGLVLVAGGQGFVGGVDPLLPARNFITPRQKASRQPAVCFRHIWLTLRHS